MLGGQIGITVERPERFRNSPFPSSVHHSCLSFQPLRRRFGETSQPWVPSGGVTQMSYNGAYAREETGEERRNLWSLDGVSRGIGV